MKIKRCFSGFPILIILSLIFTTEINAVIDSNPSPVMDTVRLDNPINVNYLQKSLSKKSPKLILTPELSRDLKQKIKSDPLVGNVYGAFKLNAQDILEEPLLERIMTGRRLLSVSREMLYRMNILGMVYQMEGSKEILDRIDDEVLAVCRFSDWNPSHYLDVAEMSLAVAIALDWTGGDLPDETTRLAKSSLIDKGINPSYSGSNWWINGTNNWNQVCNAGMIAASIMIADENPDLAARTISRSLDGMPYALAAYGPDGVYPEGATYWNYGTTFTVMTASILESALGDDFGLVEYPALKESALFKVLSEAPSGMYYNFADCGDRRSPNGDMTLAWFAKTYHDPLYFEAERFMRSPEEVGKLPRQAGAGLVWIAQYAPIKKVPELPNAWSGRGDNPIVIFRGTDDYYFGGKGGRGTVNHGNMDAGSFIWELDGIRWVIDPGNQPYHELEKTGFQLWGRCQDCERWTLITKNNYGHSTLTVNDELHVVDGFASLEEFEGGEKPSATFDLSPVFEGTLEHITRTFTKDGPRSLVIEDNFSINDSTREVTWQLMTTAEVLTHDGGAVLKQDGKEVRIENLSHPDFALSVVSLDPAPLELDRQIENLKRVELRIPAWTFDESEGNIKIRLTGE